MKRKRRSLTREDLRRIHKREKQKPSKERQIHLYSDHKYVSRRDFLRAGLISGSTYMAAPLIGSTLLRSTLALAECTQDNTGTSGGVTLGSGLPTIVISSGGGMSICSNVVPYDQSGSPLSDYFQCGILSGTGRTSFGGSELFNGSGAERAFSSILSTTARSGLNMIGMWNRMADDSPNNLVGVSGLIKEVLTLESEIGKYPAPMAALKGSFKHMQTLSLATPALANISNVNDAQNVLGTSPDDPIAQALGSSSIVEKFLGLARDLASEAKKQGVLSNLSGGNLVAEAAECGSKKNLENFSNQPPANVLTDVDPLAEQLRIQFGVDAGSNPGSQDALEAEMAYLADGRSPVTVIERGGGDYHNGTNASGDAYDESIFTLVARILNAYAAAGKRVAIFLVSDGAVSTNGTLDPNNGKPIWVSEGGERGAGVGFFMDPAGAHATTNIKQANYFTPTQAANIEGVFSNTRGEPVGVSFLVNWLAFQNKLSLLSQTSAAGYFTSEELAIVQVIA